MRVLIAHERPDVLAHGRSVLEPLGHDVHVCGDADAALAACAAWVPDVALLDAELCRRDGLALLSAIKSDGDAFRTAVIVIMPDDPDLDEAIDDLRRGAHDFLVGPDVGTGELVARVEAAGRTKQLQEALLGQADRFEQLVFEDELTRVPNRRAILAQLEALVSGARRHGRELSALMIDLDGFKALNDTHGHAAGDRALAEVARRLAGHLRAEDWLGRLGGEEFLALLPDTAPGDAARAAEKLRAAVADEPVATADGPLAVTVSIGWATWRDESPEALVRRADEALYAAKEAGRNAVVGGEAAATLRRRP